MKTAFRFCFDSTVHCLLVPLLTCVVFLCGCATPDRKYPQDSRGVLRDEGPNPNGKVLTAEEREALLNQYRGDVQPNPRTDPPKKNDEAWKKANGLD